MIMRWIACGSGNAHILGPCPNCYSAQGGLLFGTVANTYKGRVHTICLDCEKTVDYYTDAKEQRLWKLESVETRGSVSSNPRIKAKEAEKKDTQIEAKSAEKMETEIKVNEAEKMAPHFISKEAEKMATEIMAKEAEKMDTEAIRRASIFA